MIADVKESLFNLDHISIPIAVIMVFDATIIYYLSFKHHWDLFKVK